MKERNVGTINWICFTSFSIQPGKYLFNLCFMQLQAILRARRLSSIEQGHADMNCWNQSAHPRCRRGLTMFLLGNLHRCCRRDVFLLCSDQPFFFLPFTFSSWAFNHIGFLSLAPAPVLMTAFSLSFFPFPAKFGNSFLFSIAILTLQSEFLYVDRSASVIGSE